MTPRKSIPTREHDLRMHLGVVLMALQMISRPPVPPLHPDQQELIDIIKRATKSMQDILDSPVSHPGKKGRPRRREGSGRRSRQNESL